MIEIVIETQSADEVVSALRNIADRISEAGDINIPVHVQDSTGDFFGFYQVTEEEEEEERGNYGFPESGEDY